MHCYPQEKKTEYNIWKILSNVIWLIFIPRWYRINKSFSHLSSPFARVIKYEHNDDMYDNPATEAIIDFHWRKASTFFFFQFLRFVIFSLCFGVISWVYLIHEIANEEFHNILIFLIVIFYYLSTYLIATEIIQLHHHGFKKYF